jgi:hypothetical protein
LQGVPHGFPAAGTHQVECDQLLRQQAQRPGRASLRCLAAREGDEPGFLRAVKGAWLPAGGRWAGQGRIQPGLDEPLAQPLEGGHPDLERCSALLVRPVRTIDLGLQQHPCPQRLVPGYARPHDQRLEGVAFLVGQPHDVLRAPFPH